ncbi:MAG: class II glutamine amidotransferase [Gemmatimonadota bacterium]
MAHVRAASPGSIVAETNSHPFRFGPLLFMHNGDIGGFARIRHPLLERLGDDTFHRILGSTDSEHFFALFQEELAREGEDVGGTARMDGAFRRTLDTVLELRQGHAPDEHIYLNVVVTTPRRGSRPAASGSAANCTRIETSAHPCAVSGTLSGGEAHRRGWHLIGGNGTSMAGEASPCDLDVCAISALSAAISLRLIPTSGVQGIDAVGVGCHVIAP